MLHMHVAVEHVQSVELVLSARYEASGQFMFPDTLLVEPRENKTSHNVQTLRTCADASASSSGDSIQEGST